MTSLELVGIGVLVFVAAAVYDWANSHYIKANNADSYAAIGWSGGVGIVAAVGILSMMLVSPWLSLPEVGGYMAGTGFAIWQRRRRRRA